MAATCDRCDGELQGRSVELRNPFFAGRIISQLRSRMEVCPDCYAEMKADERWEL